jgi:hypothetical protein
MATRLFRAGCGALGWFGLIVLGRAAEPDFQPLWNGRDLTGWHGGSTTEGARISPASWRVEDGVLIGESDAELNESYLWTDASYGDFVLEFDVRWNGDIDSGVMLREPKLQLQLGVSRSLQRDMSGSFYVAADRGYPEAGRALEAARLLRPAGAWNTFRLEARGDTFAVWINGEPAARYTDGRFPATGPLGLQVHGGVRMRVEFRNLRLAVASE